MILNGTTDIQEENEQQVRERENAGNKRKVIKKQKD